MQVLVGERLVRTDDIGSIAEKASNFEAELPVAYSIPVFVNVAIAHW